MAAISNLILAQLGITSGELWLSKYPALVLNCTTSVDYLSFHQNFRNLLLAQSNNNSERSQLTTVLKNINAEINISTKFIKKYLEEEYGANAKSYYLAYGLVYERRNFSIAKDNDNRMKSLDMLIQTLQSTNNFMATHKYGLTYWKNLRDTHFTAWITAKSLDGTISINSGNLKIMQTQANFLQKSLRAQIRVDYFHNYKHIIRDFGFQIEKY